MATSRKINWDHVTVGAKWSNLRQGSHVTFTATYSKEIEILMSEEFPMLHANRCVSCRTMARLVLLETKRSLKREKLVAKFFQLRETQWTYVALGRSPAAGRLIVGVRGHGTMGVKCGHVLYAGPGKMFSVGLIDYLNRMEAWRQNQVVERPAGFNDLVAKLRNAAPLADEASVMQQILADWKGKHAIFVHFLLKVIPDIVPAQKFTCGAVIPEPLLAIGERASGYEYCTRDSMFAMEYLLRLFKQNQ